MNPFNLKAHVAVLHKKTASDLIVGGVDLFLRAVNNAQRQAQRRHNFEASRVLAELVIDGVNGGALSSATISGAIGETLTVTGTLSPDATGTYSRQGFFDGLPLYIKEGATPFFIYYNANATFYILASTLSTGSVANRWTSASAVTPIGSMTAAGTNTGTATVALATSANWAGIREVVAATRSNADGTFLPLDFANPEVPLERDRTARELSDFYDPNYRYPSDATILDQGWNTTLIQRGNMIYVYPTPPSSVPSEEITISLEGYGLLPSIDAVGTASDPTPNFLWEQPDWLQWFCVLELNFYFKTFVARTEGNVPPPVEFMNQAWADLIAADTFLVDSHTTRSR